MLDRSFVSDFLHHVEKLARLEVSFLEVFFVSFRHMNALRASRSLSAIELALICLDFNLSPVEACVI